MNINLSAGLMPDYLTFIRERTGMMLSEVHHRTLGKVVNERAKWLGLPPGAYLAALKKNTAEQEHFLNAVTINETYFFREERQFAALQKCIFPSLPAGKTVHLWSATCSSGEEPLSLAILAEEFLKRPYVILATDINSSALGKFSQRTYFPNSFRKDGESYHYLFARYGAPHQGNGWKVNAGIFDKIKIIQKNLYLDSLSDLPGDISVVFFRNTLLYMDTDVKRYMIEKIVKQMTLAGCLFVSSSEVPHISHPQLELREEEKVFFFVKKGATDAYIPETLTGQENR